MSLFIMLSELLSVKPIYILLKAGREISIAGKKFSTPVLCA